MNINRLFNTARHLKPIQILYRFRRAVYTNRPKLAPPPRQRPATGKPWTPSVEGPQSLIGPWRFRFLNREQEPSGWNDQELEKLWLYNLHYFDDLAAQKASERHDWHRELILKWIEENPPGTGNGWEPYPTSRRLVNWIKWTLEGNKPDDRMIHSMAVQARWLKGNLEYHLLGNHLIANAKALIFAGLYFEGDEANRWFDRGISILEKELSEQILLDGGHFERSPMYHAIILEDLLDLVNITHTFGQDSPAAWIDAAEKMVVWLTGMSHPDGEIVLFNDAAFGIAPAPKEIFSYADRLGFKSIFDVKEGLTNFKQTGYVRLQKGPVTAFLDVAPIGPDYLPGHAHADTLNFELSLFGHRVIVDSGTSLYGTSLERMRQRGTAAHNTVVIDGKDSSEIWNSFRVARRANPENLVIDEAGDTVKVACSHDGYKRLSGRPIHRRQWLLGEGHLQISDSIHGGFQSASGRFHFHPDLRVEKGSTRKGRILLPSGQEICWRIERGHGAIQPSTYHPEFGLSMENVLLEVDFHGPEAVVLFTW